MEKLLEQAKELGRALQADDRFLKVKAAQEAADADEQLQELIGEFNLKRMALNEESLKSDEEKDAEKQRELNVALRESYAKIMENPSMVAYNEAKTEFDKVAQGVTAIINMAMQGLDPDTYEESQGCAGDCSACGGCH